MGTTHWKEEEKSGDGEHNTQDGAETLVPSCSDSQEKGRVKVAQLQPIGPAGARLHRTHADSKTGKGHKLKHGKFQLHSRIFNPMALLVGQLVVFLTKTLEQAAGRRGFEMFRTPVPAPIRPFLSKGPDWITPRDPFQPKCQFHDFYCQFGCFLSKGNTHPPALLHVETCWVLIITQVQMCFQQN